MAKNRNAARNGASTRSGTPYRGERNSAIMPRSPSEALEPERAPEPPRGSRQRRQHPAVVFLNRSITFLLALLIVAGGVSYFVRLQFDRPGPLSYPTVFAVAKNEGVTSVARRLEQDGVINDRWTFFIASRYFKVHNKIRSGEYNIKANASLRDILDTLVEGKSVQFGVTVPEGLTSYQIVERLKANSELVGDILEMPPEGSLMPDTYRVARGTSRQELLIRMQAEQKKFLDSVWPTRSRDVGLSTPDDVVNLASIVEKESGRADERARIAAVYLNRLKKRMRLEADPTIIYGASEGHGNLGRGILKSELESAENPYNTYRNYGLPPTPIANPGRAAIEAVLRPAKSGDLFFVADGNGGHVFAETFSDHKKNVSRWRKAEAERDDEIFGGAPPVVPDLDKLQTVEIPLPERNPRR